jgi:teichuronic acid biosynthesis glycosyltransferase TuaC
MRIAVVTSSYPSQSEDPSGHFVSAEVRALIEVGHEVTLLVPKASCPRSVPLARLCELPHGELFGWPGTLARLRQRPWRMLGLVPYTLAARRQLAAQGPFDQVVAHWILPAFWPICRDFEGQTVVVAHGSDVRLLERLPAPLQHSIVTALGRDNVRLRSVSRELAMRLQRLARANQAKEFAIVVEPARLDVPTLPARPELRRQLGLSPAPLVVIVGRAVKDKRMDVAIEAVRAATTLAALPTPPHVLVIGDGPERVAWMRRFTEVKWLGQLGRSDTLRYIRTANLLVSASVQEGAPTAIREARCLGTEVVAARAGDLVEWSTNDPELHVVEDFSFEPRGLACKLIAQCLRKAGSASGPIPENLAVS